MVALMHGSLVLMLRLYFAESRWPARHPIAFWFWAAAEPVLLQFMTAKTWAAFRIESTLYGGAASGVQLSAPPRHLYCDEFAQAIVHGPVELQPVPDGRARPAHWFGDDDLPRWFF